MGDSRTNEDVNIDTTDTYAVGAAFEHERIKRVDTLWRTIAPPSNRAVFQDCLHEAIFWSALRQELFLSIVSQASPAVDLDERACESALQDDGNDAWCNRILAYLFWTVQYCFGESRNSSRYDELLTSASHWMETKPASFTPVYAREALGEAMFPEIWCLNNCTAAGLQYYHLARILLVAHNPRVPQLGLAKNTAAARVEVSDR